LRRTEKAWLTDAVIPLMGYLVCSKKGAAT